MRNTIIGIDPGKTGAMAVFRGMNLEYVADTPLILGNGKSRFDAEGMLMFMKFEQRAARTDGGDVLVCIEQQHAFPAQGGVGNFTSGFGYGLWIGLLKGMGVGVLPITAMRWRSLIFTGGESQALNAKAKTHREANKMRKQASIERARIVPCAAKFLNRKKDDGRAEAILIGMAARLANINQKAAL